MSTFTFIDWFWIGFAVAAALAAGTKIGNWLWERTDAFLDRHGLL